MEDEETDDSEAKLQRDSTKLIRELETSIPLFLYKGIESPGPVKIRKSVKQSNTARLESLFNAFQEWPQLLDPTLRVLVEPLVSSFQKYIQNHPALRPRCPVNEDDRVEPLPRAICKLLYTLCKVRGVKVVTIFLTNEPSMLEPILDAFENWSFQGDGTEDDGSPIRNKLTWEEKYVMLLWLSHLARTPFDLASISSLDSKTDPGITLPFEPPVGLSNLASRLLALGLRYLQSATKEQEAAKMLLVRLCIRPDMNHLALHERCIGWALQSLANLGGDSKHVSIYSPIGILSFLAGFFKCCDGTAAAPFLVPVLDYMQDIIAGGPGYAKLINRSAAVQKLLIKIHRSFAVHLLSGNVLPAGSLADGSDLLGTIVDHLLTTLGDKDNRVRFAASKALSIIVQKLDLEMTTQLVDDITKRLQADVVLESIKSGARILPPLALNPASLKQDLSAVDSLRWQGLILTLSHLLFRHSTPQRRLTAVVGHIMDGLDFEQRSSTGVSVGSAVRDAACFGMWSLARKYTTRELLRVAASSIRSRKSPHKHTSVFGVLAAELVVTATLDPEGNIRRGASAALQELVGRHPDRIPNGIALVQIVDYQAVGLRSRAMCTVALQAANLDDLYLYAVSDGLLSWRAISSPEANIRRFAAFAIGQIFRRYGSKPMSSLQQRFESSKSRSVDEWHGLYQAFAAAIHNDPSFVRHGATILRAADLTEDGIYVLREDASLSAADVTATGKNANLAAEALCIMICVLGQQSGCGMDAQLLDYHSILIELSLQHYSTSQRKVAYRDAPVVLFNQLNQQGQKGFLNDWVMKIKEAQQIQHSPEINMSRIAVLGSILSEGWVRSVAVIRDSSASLREVLLSQLCKDSDWQVKTAALGYLYKPVYLECLRHHFDTEPLHQALVDCLSDYSILASRDVGSEVRMQAIETVASMDDSMLRAHAQRTKIFEEIYGLAVEKLDRVRDTAWKCIVKHFSILSLESDKQA
ncbi:MAG: hypothetical protein Q9225_004568 [Loekoesia sp. 1 TL-2023]